MCTYGHRAFALASLLVGVLAGPATGQTLKVSPALASVPFGGDRRLTAYVNGLASTAVVWSVDDVVGGDATVGFVDATGKYTAPASGVPGSQVTVRAASRKNADSAASCLVTLRNPVPWLTGVTPRTVPIGAFTLQILGSRFVEGAEVRWNGMALPTIFQSPTQLTATGTATQSGWMKVTVANPGPDAVSGSWSVLVSGVPVATRTMAAVAPTRTATRAEPTRTATVPVPTRTATIPAPTRTATRAEPTRTATMPVPTRTATIAEPTRTATRAEPTRTATVPVPTRTETQRAEPTRTMEPSATRPESTRTTPPTATAGTERTATMMPSVPSRTEASRTIPPTATARTEASRTIVPTATARTETSRTIAPTATAVGMGTATASPTANVPDPLAVSSGRLLDQTTFGPTQALMTRVAQLGIAGFIDEQLAMPESPWPGLETTDRGDVIDAFFGNALSGQDQLRQRVIYALSEIIVEAMNKNTNADEIIPWLQLLSRNAFGNYRTLLREIALDASMGKYLDLANSGIMGGAANENFPREVMQLFSLGLYRLNLDGSVQVDAQNVPIPTYTETDVKQLAKALTGWTYGNPSGTPPSYANSNYYPGPMLPVAAYHNKTAKTILGQTLPSNQTAPQDLDGAIDILFQHPNIAPFVAIRLIHGLVTSNPSPAYIARVASAFNGGTRGDMKAVLRAVLLDPEARNDTPPANFGRLRTPMQHTIALARALNLDVGPASQFAYLFYDMHEGMLDAPSVFGHYSPMYHIPVVGLFGPEFQIYSASSAIDRANLFYWFMYSPWPINPALQPFVAVAGNAAALVNAVDTALLYGQMLPATRAALLTALPAMPDNNARVLTAVYLTAMSGEYLVQR